MQNQSEERFVNLVKQFIDTKTVYRDLSVLVPNGNVFEKIATISDRGKKDLIIHITDKEERKPTDLINFLKEIGFPKSTRGVNLIKEVVKDSKQLDYIDLLSMINIAEITDEKSKSEIFIEFVNQKGPIFNKKQIADMAKNLEIKEELFLQSLQKLPTKKISFEVDRSSSDTKEQEQQKMLALVSEALSFSNFETNVEMGIKNGYSQFQGDDNKIALTRAFLAKPRAQSDISLDQFDNFIRNIGIEDSEKTEKLIGEFVMRDQIKEKLSIEKESEILENQYVGAEITKPKKYDKLSSLLQIIATINPKNPQLDEEFSQFITLAQQIKTMVDDDNKMKIWRNFFNKIEISDEPKIASTNFAKLIGSLDIQDENKRIELITEFFASDKSIINSFNLMETRLPTFINSLGITNDSYKTSLTFLKDVCNEEKINTFSQTISEKFKSKNPLFSSEGVRANLAERFVRKSKTPIDKKSLDKLITDCSIHDSEQITRITNSWQNQMQLFSLQQPAQRSSLQQHQLLQEMRPLEYSQQPHLTSDFFFAPVNEQLTQSIIVSTSPRIRQIENSQFSPRRPITEDSKAKCCAIS